jgi:phospholipid/cholesterol/gamma-HCH transport system ATP-binding protein
MIIRVRGLKKAFDGNIILAGIDLDIKHAQNLALVGVSGSGKTVLMKCLLGLIEVDEGSIQFDGHEMVGLHSWERFALLQRVGVLFQSGALFDSLPVWENVAFSHLRRGQLTKTAAYTFAVERLAAVGLSDGVSELSPAELSGGMQRRVALARALAQDPEALFLDNPTAGLDPILTATMSAVIKDALSRSEAAALTITHDLAVAKAVAQRAAFLSEGRIVWEGPILSLSAATQPDVRRFLRASAPQTREAEPGS